MGDDRERFLAAVLQNNLNQVRPNPVLAPRAVYETKAARWQKEWPGLTVEPWPLSHA